MEKSNSIVAFSMPESELITTLQNSLYPNAALNSVVMVLSYCKASALDPMMKPVHIVPMWDSASGKMRDVIMPGVGLYRTQAARSGGYAGISDAIFGEEVTEKIGGVEVTYPRTCTVTVKRLLPNGQIAEFSATERWKENYAVKGGKERSIAPNAMWSKRPYGQLAKCTEAQALRKAFPEAVGSAPTSDEMEGKALGETDAHAVIDGATGEIINAKAETPLPPYPSDRFDKNLPAWARRIEAGKCTADDVFAQIGSTYSVTEHQRQTINAIKCRPAEAADPNVTDGNCTKPTEETAS